MKADVNSYLRATGNVCHQWSYLEYLLSQLIWHLLKLDKAIGIIVTGEIEITAKAKMALKLSKELLTHNDLISILVLISKLQTLAEKRNRVVHGSFSSHPDSVYAAVELHRGKNAGIREQISINDIDSVAEEINILTMSFAVVLEKYGISTH